MLNQSGISKVAGVTKKTLLIAPELAFSLSCKLANTGVVAVDGKKVIKAGTPIKGDLEARDTAFEVAGEEDTPVGLALSEVDVTSGTKNGQVLIFGFVDSSKLEVTIDSAMRAKLPKITFVS